MTIKNKIVYLFFLLVFIGLTPTKAQVYEISLLTCEPGEQLYSSFGQTPNFYGKFATGKLDYMLSVTTYADFILEYDYYKRDVREQVLALSSDQIDFLLQHLWAQYDPARRFYRYDFFFNNCATKIRDAFEIALGDDLVWNDSVQVEEKTFRTLIDEYVYPLPWADLGIDLALGSVIDRDATEREEQFLPDYMEAAFAKATIQGDGPSRPLVRESRVILEYPEKESSMDLLNPYVIFWGVAVLFTLITFVGHKKKRLFIGFDLGLFSILGVLGIVVAFLWFFTDHSATKWNWNILWAFPGHLALVWGLTRKELQPWVRKYLLFALIMADAAVVFWILGWQSFHPSLIPLMLVIILRTNYLYYNLGGKSLKAA